ncbi:hypothetical protein [Flavobacterium sp.]|uniref:hypothetical protein n=1 Tax=Flavobacterium sp. TaxID=239 RepID=UPI00260F4BD2|nr:hypothetical protein [Flavobacterium sp.]
MPFSFAKNSRKLFFVILFCISSSLGFAQQKVFIVPTQFDWQTKENQYRISTIVKNRIAEKDFVVYYSSDILPEAVLNNACNNFTIKVVRLKGTFLSKIRIDVADCQNQIVLQSIVGSSKSKEYELAYQEALNEALVDIIPKLSTVKRSEIPSEQAANTKQTTAAASTVDEDQPKNAGILAQRTSRGYNFTTEKGVLVQLQQSSKPGVFLAFLDTQPAVAFYNSGKLLVEYYEGNNKISINYEVQLPQ